MDQVFSFLQIFKFSNMPILQLLFILVCIFYMIIVKINFETNAYDYFYMMNMLITTITSIKFIINN